MAAVISAYEYEDQTIIQSFDMTSLERLRQQPRLKLAALYTAVSPLEATHPGVSVVGPPWELVTAIRRWCATPTPAGVRSWSGPSRAPQPSGPLLDARVDGIITSRPDVVRAMLEGR